MVDVHPILWEFHQKFVLWFIRYFAQAKDKWTHKDRNVVASLPFGTLFRNAARVPLSPVTVRLSLAGHLWNVSKDFEFRSYKNTRTHRRRQRWWMCCKSHPEHGLPPCESCRWSCYQTADTCVNMTYLLRVQLLKHQFSPALKPPGWSSSELNITWSECAKNIGYSIFSQYFWMPSHLTEVQGFP